MKLIERIDEQKTVRLGIVKLGTAVGKMKYALIDESDIPIIHEYKFDARLEIDRDGEGIQVIAMGHPKSNKVSSSPIPLHDIIWIHRNGPIDDDFKVSHLNGITMDNRMDNLTLIPNWLSKTEQNDILSFRCTETWTLRSTSPSSPTNPNRNLSHPHLEDDVQSESDSSINDDPSSSNNSQSQSNTSAASTDNKAAKRQGENSLYWKAITQLLANETDEKIASSAPYSRAYYTTEGELISRDCPSFYFFECHYPPCTAIETEPREFAMCGRCQQARYCGRECQRDDWAVHRDNCNEAHRRGSHSSSTRSSRSSARRSLTKGDVDR